MHSTNNDQFIFTSRWPTSTAGQWQHKHSKNRLPLGAKSPYFLFLILVTWCIFSSKVQNVYAVDRKDKFYSHFISRFVGKTVSALQCWFEPIPKYCHVYACMWREKDKSKHHKKKTINEFKHQYKMCKSIFFSFGFIGSILGFVCFKKTILPIFRCLVGQWI